MPSEPHPNPPARRGIVAGRDYLWVAVLALAVGVFVAALQRQPGYTDASYYLNAALRLVHGQGLTDAALWTYIGLPAQTSLPAPAFLYWMPLGSLLEAIGAAVGGLLGFAEGFHPAQIGLIVCYAALACLGYRLGAQIGGSRRTAWLAALLTIFSGFFLPYWTSPDTFAVFGLVGAGSLVAIGEARTNGRLIWWAAGGALAALAHLTRADGLLFILILIIAAFWPPYKRGLRAALIGIAAYLLVMLPWAVRNLNTIGSPLPLGGFQTAWLRDYDQIAAYPPDSSLSDFLAWGPGNILQSRLEAFATNLQTFVVVEGLIVLTPLMLLGAWRKRFELRLTGFFLYTIGLHVLMTFVFAFPGERGGLLHSAAALVPFWGALGAIGLDEALAWAAKKRRWPLAQAKRVFGAALIGYAILLSALLGARQIAAWNAAGAAYRQIGAALPRDTIVMVNDPPTFYYQTGLSAVVVPDSTPTSIQTLAARFGLRYLILDENRPQPLAALYDGSQIVPFLRLLPPGTFNAPDSVRIYEVVTDR